MLHQLDAKIGNKNSLGEIKSFIILQVLTILLGEQIYVFCSDDKNARKGAINFDGVRCISVVSLFVRLQKELNWKIDDALPYINSLVTFCENHNQTTFKVVEASEVGRFLTVPCEQVLYEIFNDRFIEL